MSDLNEVIEQSFIQYAGAVLQNRALVDVRDGLKPSARQIFYSMTLRKLTSKNPYRKTTNAVGEAMADFYIHGDSSCEAIIMRAGQPFAMRYPLTDIKGNAGSLISSGNWAAPRYTEVRLSKITDMIFEDIEKDTISEWRDSYDNTKQYPAVLPTKGFYNICNGTSGIGVGMASSVPQYNLKELNNALITLLNNPNCSFEDIYCAPDFATGGILYNEAEVKQSMERGTGFACKLRSVVSFDIKDRCFVVTEIPYGVYTNTICKELEEIVNDENNPGIERFNDLTGKTPLIKIYLTKKANPDKILPFLFKNTSLQSHFGINFTMLDKGRFPKVFTWKEMLQAHIDHEKEVYRKGFEFDLKKIQERLHIIDGLFICLARIEEVIKVIKESSSSAAASTALQKEFLLDGAQAKAVLDMKLARLANLEVKKLREEYDNLLKEVDRINEILNSESLLNEQLIKGWKEVAKKFGDERRTKIIHLSLDGDEPIEQKQISLTFTNNGAIFVEETSTLYAQRRNGVGNKFKLEKGEYIVDNFVGNNTDTILFFTSHGNFYHKKLGEFTIGEKQYLSNYISILPFETIKNATIIDKNLNKSIIFLTKKGIIKKSSLAEYSLKRNTGATAIALDAGDEIVSVSIGDSEKFGIMTREGNFIIISLGEIRSIGRTARGVIGIKLNESDYVVSGRIVPDSTTEIMSITSDAFAKRSPFSEFHVTGRGTKGIKIQKADNLCDFMPINGSEDLLITSSSAQIRLKYDEIPLLSRGALGNKVIKLGETSEIIKISKI